MEWQQIIGFHHVAKLGSFTKAADATFRTQSALTQQIKSLEEEFDCRLFERIGKRKIILTPPGETLFRFSESLLEEYDRLVVHMGEHKGFMQGRLGIAAPFTTLYHLLPKVVRKYNSQFPWVELSLFDRPQREAVHMVRGGDVDFGIAGESVISSELSRRSWKKVEPVLLTPSDHPLSHTRRASLEKIVQYPLILPPRNSDFQHRSLLEELFRQHGLTFHVVMESSNIELSSIYVEMGLGVSFASIVKGLPVFGERRLEQIRMDHYLPVENICVAMRKDKKLTLFQETFLELMFNS